MDKRAVGGWLAAALIGVVVEPAFAATGKASAAVAREGPFGIQMGEPVTALHAVPLGGHAYSVPHPPMPNDDFSTITVGAYPSAGVCSIEASEALIDDDPSGAKAMAAVDRIAQILTAKYGPAEKVDDCNDGSSACDQSWTLTAQQGSAHYGYRWLQSEAARSQGIDTVVVYVLARSEASSLPSIVYTSNGKACAAARDAAEGAGL